MTNTRRPRGFRERAQLQQKYQTYRNVVENATDFIYLIDKKGKVLSVNKSAAVLFGRTPREIEGKSIFELFPKEIATEFWQHLSEVFKTGNGELDHDTRMVVGEKEFWTSVRLDPVKDNEGRVLAVLGVTRDITESKRTGMALRESEERYRALFENSIDAILLTAPDGRILAANPEASRMLQRSEEEICQVGRDGVVDLKDPRLPAALEERTRTGRYSGGLNMKRKDGTIFPTEVSSVIFKDKDGQDRTSMIIRDITERRNFEINLRKSEERFRQLFMSSPIPYLISRPEGSIIDVNEAWVRMSGYSREEAISRTTFELGMHLNSNERDQLVRDVLQKQRLNNVEIDRRTKSGDIRTLLNSLEVVELGGEKCILNMQVDITERKKLDEELKRYSQHLVELVQKRTEELARSEKKYRNIINTSPSCVYTTSINGDILEMNPAGIAMLGYDNLEELKKVNFENIYANPKDRKEFIRIAEAGAVKNFEKRFRRKDGKIIDVIENSYAIKNAEGRIVEFHGIIIDLSDRLQIERRLKESEARFRGFAERSFDIIVMLDLDWRINYVSPAVLLLTGYAPDELLGKTVQSYLDKRTQHEKTQKLAQVTKGEIVRSEDFEIVRKDGSILHTEVNASPIIREEKIVGVQLIIRDISERFRLAEMRDQFISDVTHELRTPLVSIQGYLELTLSGNEISNQTRKDLEVVKRNTNILAKLVDDLLDVQRISSERLRLDLQPLKLQNLIHDCVQQVQPLINERNHNLQLDIPDHELTIIADKTKLSQVMINLLQNAIKFTPDNGRIIIRLKDEKSSIRVQVSDTGIGIRQEDLEKVFEPFAAIKKVQYVKGTGLGMNVSRGLVQAHGGKIWAESAGEGQGVTFTFTLPKRKE